MRRTLKVLGICSRDAAVIKSGSLCSKLQGLKLTGVLVLILIIGFGVTACPEPDDSSSNRTPFIITGSFASQDDDIDAKFYAKSSDGRSARAARSAAHEVAMEGLLEDGDITFKLKGSYNSSTRLYVLSAASSILRYSISGDIDSSEPGKAIVQVKSGSDWTVIEIDVEAAASGDTFNSSGEVQDALANGITQDMWGVWWGSEPMEKGAGDIVQSGKYYYVIDAFTIVQYVDRAGTWNVEGYTCFFEGLTKSGGVATGRVEFDYVDQMKIDTEFPSWWIECITGYVKANGSNTEKTKIDEQNWFDAEWVALVNKYAAKAQADGTVGDKWNELFGDEPYFYKAFKKDALRLQDSNQLQMGKYYQAGTDIYFSRQANVADNFSQLRWESNIYNRAVKSTASVPAPVESNVRNFDAYSPNDFIDLSSSKAYSVVDLANEGRKEVLKVVKPNGDSEWAVGIYLLSAYEGRTATITFSAEIKRVGGDGMLLWQISEDTYPVVGSPILDAPANIWHNVSGTWTGNLNKNEKGYVPDLYLTAANSNSPNATYYIDNFTVSIIIEGEYQLGSRFTWTDGDDNLRGWLLSPEIRAKIADGTLKYFVIGLDAEAVEAAGGIGGIGIVFNGEGGYGEDGYSNHEQAFPWYWAEGKTGSHADWNGWISYEDLIKAPGSGGYGATKNEYGLWLQYDITTRPDYDAIKTAMGTATWAQFGLNVYEAWKNGAQWIPIRTALLKQ